MNGDRLPSQEDVDLLRTHWAVSGIPVETLERAHRMANELVVRKQIGTDFLLNEVEHPDEDLIRHVSTAYEIAAAENVRAFLGSGNEDGRKIARVAAAKAYDMNRALTRPEGDDALLHVLTLAALAYIGDRTTDLWGRLKDSPIEHFEDDGWDRRLLQATYECWIRLFRKNGWKDLEAVANSIHRLRQDQAEYEEQFLAQESSAYEQRTHALRLIALYNWARATELLARFMLQGDVQSINTMLDQFFENAEMASLQSGDATLHALLRWLVVAAKRMVSLSLWSVALTSPKIREFVGMLTRGAPRQMFEFLPPQRAALLEQGILNPAKRAVVIDMPTSSGKTLLAEFRIIQALTQFADVSGWVAYVAPTKALVSQLTRRLRRDLGPIGLRVDELSAAVDVDVLETELLSSRQESFDVLVTTPEKLMAILRREIAIARPLALALIDEAHNIDDAQRGLRLELLLAIIKRERPDASFMLMMPNVPNAGDLATWLSDDDNEKMALASFGAIPWRPNDVLIGRYEVEQGPAPRNWRLRFDTMIAPRKSLDIEGSFSLATVAPLALSWGAVHTNKGRTAGAMSVALSVYGERTSVCLLRSPRECWAVARDIRDSVEDVPFDDDIALVQRYLATEISPAFELIGMLGRGVAVHHSGLSDDAKALIEWLVERQKVRVLCATSTIAQGINFPISSVFLSSVHVAGVPARKLTYREFWNLAGRTGRVGQTPVGIIGITGTDDDIRTYLVDAADDLLSRLELLAATLESDPERNLSVVIQRPDWDDFRNYIAHLFAQRNVLEGATPEQLLRNTLGYSRLAKSADPVKKAQARRLLDTTLEYAARLSKTKGIAAMADSTGFSPEGVQRVLTRLREDAPLHPEDWQPSSLFSGTTTSVLPRLIGVLLQVRQLQDGLSELSANGHGGDQIARIASAWVNGSTIEQIAREYFVHGEADPRKLTAAITAATKGIYKALSYAATWGISALSHLPKGVSGLDRDKLSENDTRIIDLLPAMIYHGVSTEDAIAMRVNGVPRSVANQLGEHFRHQQRENEIPRIQAAREYVSSLRGEDWDEVRPAEAAMNGRDYKRVWEVLTGLAS